MSQNVKGRRFAMTDSKMSIWLLTLMESSGRGLSIFWWFSDFCFYLYLLFCSTVLLWSKCCLSNCQLH